MEQIKEEFVFDELFIKGFNQGYILAEHTPGMVITLMKTQLPEDEYFSGFKAGKGQFTSEKIRNKAMNITLPRPNRDKSKGKNMDM